MFIRNLVTFFSNRAIDSSHEHDQIFSDSDKITIIADIDTKSNYRDFLDQVKDLGMTKSKFNYLLATIVTFNIYHKKLKIFLTH